ncbi:SDR family NAD(P)-dependent oxidoreductase [Brevibacillus agri]|nr:MULTISPECIES: SDR family NAD(P)-dependent oxidoreductase [Brevibacillus]QHZ56630.1 SDR family NAD(P)-dependent oxidoreductase [Brevibacillus sp. NSP2.1]MBY0050138.1 SDR family NAD(P)-dependent oxidoreductase [Brevibacillus agri]MDR9505233.1 SDR family NAD(P)-dependent oxidoreductase [Brevibacillus agri]MED1646429.1 SDR family NAD(P)-dependent oxidoreductase [Brevibacillus agri]MED1652742.1 SDR family NAD(P)-dependent oxidoreductase [Brevibacillus agri]
MPLLPGPARESAKRSRWHSPAKAPTWRSTATTRLRRKSDEVVAQLAGCSGQVMAAEGDVTDVRFVQRLVDETLAKFGRIDILVNNAGILTQSLIHEMTVETWDRMIDVDLRSVFLLTRHVVPHMIEQKSGRIINIASQIGQKGGVKLSYYAAAKAGVIGFTKSRTTKRDSKVFSRRRQYWFILPLVADAKP